MTFCEVHPDRLARYKSIALCHSCYNVRWLNAHPKAKRKAKLNHLKHHLRRKYGLTLEEYREMRRKAHGRCTLCRKRRRLVLDHSHRTHKARGLVCELLQHLTGWIGQPTLASSGCSLSEGRDEAGADDMNKFYVLNGPKRGHYVTRAEAEVLGYLLYNRSSLVQRDDSERGYHFTEAPKAIFIYIDSLPPIKPVTSRLG